VVPGHDRFRRRSSTISDPLDESWIRFGIDPSTSAAELLAEQLPASRIVTAFNTTSGGGRDTRSLWTS
jgi:hypothetical protein